MAKPEVGGDTLIDRLRAVVDLIPQPQVHRETLLWPSGSRDLDYLHRLLFDGSGARVGAGPHRICEGPSSQGAPADDVESNVEALRIKPVAEGETAVSSVQVVSQVLSQNSSNLFLKSVCIKPVPSSKSSSSNESELREQLAAEATAAVQGEIDELRKRSEEAEKKLARTQKEMEEYKKLIEISNKAMEENNALLKRILAINNASST
ncbi:unnamed protein product [Miscanthus lutarioriparius]|uniref:Uncharacterized protein n=1 Tax=Miscanthus lutarioriparius TaxID=422564 RepID=A0A811P0H5_9POAL|nr:unnamed protein product [Miscanthus lutarioriparius]